MRSQRRLFIAVVISAISFIATAQDAIENKKRPAPSAAERSAAEKTIKDIFRSDYAKAGMAAKSALAAKFRKEADHSPDDFTARFVFLSEARDLAADTGDVPGALEAEAALVEVFDVDQATALASLLEHAATSVGRENAQTFVVTALKASALSIGAEQWDRAAKVQGFARSVLRKFPTRDQNAALKRQVDRLTKARGDSARLQAAEKKLKTAPDDPVANFTIGRYRCFVKGDWTTGLTALAKGSDAALKALADQEHAASAKDSAEQLGDAWWAYSQTPSGASDADDARRRAGYWYAKVTTPPGGLKKSVIENRLAEARKIAADLDDQADPFEQLNQRLASLREWVLEGGQWDQAPNGLIAKGDSRATFKHDLPADFTLTFTLNVLEGMRPRLYFGDLYFGNEGFEKALWVFGPVNGAVAGKTIPYQNAKPMAAKIIFAGDRFDFWIDGKRVCEGGRPDHVAPKLHLSGGDGWSPGKTAFTDLRISAAPAKLD